MTSIRSERSSRKPAAKRAGRRRRLRDRLGEPERSLTGLAKVVAVTPLVDRLALVAALDAGIGRVKKRVRGISAGQLLVGMALARLAGEATLAGLDRVRADEVAWQVGPVPVAPSRTAGRLAQRFGGGRRAGIDAGPAVVVERWLSLLPAQRRSELARHRPTIDLDNSDVEVYGRMRRGVAFIYEGKRAGRPLLASSCTRTWPPPACGPVASVSPG